MNKLDRLINRLNKLIARLLGKKQPFSLKSSTANKTHTKTPILFNMLLLILFIWLTSGIYVIEKNTSAIVVSNNKFIKTIKGFSVGILLPMPLESLITINNDFTNMQYLYTDKNLTYDKYIFLYKNSLHTEQKYELVIKYAYRVNSPQLLYNNYLSKLNKKSVYNNTWIDNFNLQLQSIATKTINKHLTNKLLDKPNLLAENLVVLSNEITQQLNDYYRDYGIETKIIFLNLQNISQNNSLSIINNADQLISSSRSRHVLNRFSDRLVRRDRLP